ncbi:hypothetical protein OG802_16880 [Streptomyces sp. NBC_00704]|uniref:hypothetical protein n=1 Tax=Streptomyces sp. NBC_00704 TaxID=2975809 RepID=UPI002E2EEA5D|nr:hypothetical protein [Streptomyces sp. NBC_00704]
MYDLIRRTLEGMRLLLAPGTGKRRRTHRHRARFCPHFTAELHDPAPMAAQLPPHRSPYGLVGSLDGAESALVRPYLAARDRETALQQRRRLIGAQEVAA